MSTCHQFPDLFLLVIDVLKLVFHFFIQGIEEKHLFPIPDGYGRVFFTHLMVAGSGHFVCGFKKGRMARTK